jgi:imidazolonepropionase
MIVKNIATLYGFSRVPSSLKKGAEMMNFPTQSSAWLKVESGKIEDFGSMEDYKPEWENAGTTIIDATGRMVLPSFCDSHTHIVFAKWREQEFLYKLKGMSYEEIAASGGGILNSARVLQNTSENELFEGAKERMTEMLGYGTGSIEIKSGYGLTLKDEIKMLRVVKRLKESSKANIKATFLGAHAFPKEFWESRDQYVKIIVDEMLPAIAAEKLADFVDVFCDKGFFDVRQTDRILSAAAKYGLKPKIHANELDYSGGVQVGVKNHAVSVDHLECVGDEEIETLLHSNTIPTLLPGTAFFLNIEFPPARKMLEAGLPLALASDYNPGSSPSGNMMFAVVLACIKMKMLPAEAFTAATLNAAYAMEVNDVAGELAIGKDADFYITDKGTELAYLPYTYTKNHIYKAFVKGQEV